MITSRTGKGWLKQIPKGDSYSPQLEDDKYYVLKDIVFGKTLKMWNFEELKIID